MSCSATCRRTRSRASPSRRSSRSTRRSSTACSCDRDGTPRKGPQIPRWRAGGSGANGGAPRPEVRDRGPASGGESPRRGTEEGTRGGPKNLGGEGSPDRAARFEARGTRGEGEGARSREGDPRARSDECGEAARRRGRGGPRRGQGPPQIEGRRERLASREGTTRQEGGGPRGEGGRAEEEGRRGGVPPGGAGPPDEGTRGTRRGPLDRPRQTRRGDTPRPRDNQGGGTEPCEVARARSRGGRSPQDLAGSVGSSRGGTRTGTLSREKGPLQITP